MTAQDVTTGRPRVVEYGRREVGRMPRATYWSVLVLAGPTLLEQVLHGLIGLVDTYVAGHNAHGLIAEGHAVDATVVNAAASAAVGTMTYMQWFTGLMVSALGVGATAIVARAIGAGRLREANRVAGTALTSAFLVGIALAATLFAFAEPFVWLVGLKGLAAEYGVQYLRIMTITICLQTAGQIGMACLRGAGDTFRPMLITGTIAAVNAVTVPALAWGWWGLPAMGIQGNALGTMIAYAIAGVATVVLLLSGWARIRLEGRHFRVVGRVLKRVLRIGMPSWVEGMLLWGGQFLIVMLVINRNDQALAEYWDVANAGDVSGVTMAAHNAVLRIESFAFLPGFGFGIAASALVGQYLGARMPSEAHRAATLANRLAFITMTLAAIPMVLFPAHLLGLLVNSSRVVEVGTWPMVLAGLAQPGFAIAIIMASGLKGAGETRWPLISTVAGMFVIRVPILLGLWWALVQWGYSHWALLAVWVGIFMDLNARAVLNGLVFRRGRWKEKRV